MGGRAWASRAARCWWSKCPWSGPRWLLVWSFGCSSAWWLADEAASVSQSRQLRAVCSKASAQIQAEAAVGRGARCQAQAHLVVSHELVVTGTEANEEQHRSRGLHHRI